MLVIKHAMFKSLTLRIFSFPSLVPQSEVRPLELGVRSVLRSAIVQPNNSQTQPYNSGYRHK